MRYSEFSLIKFLILVKNQENKLKNMIILINKPKNPMETVNLHEIHQI